MINYSLTAGESVHNASGKELNDTTETNTFPLEFVNDEPNDENFLDDGNMDDYSSSPSFEVIEEVKINHGMFISTRQVAETFFHQIVPSQTVKVHLNPVMMTNFSIGLKADAQRRSENNGGSFLRKFKAFARGKLAAFNKSIKPCRGIARAIICMVALFLVHIYFGEYMEKEKLEDSFNANDKVDWKGCSNDMKYKRSRPGRIKSNDRKEQLSLLINTIGGNGLSAFSKSTGIFLTVSLALCTIWANHIIPAA